jgi:IS30 family transposase
MMDKNNKRSLWVMTDRLTLHTSLHNLKNRQINTDSKVIIKKFNKVRYPLHTITFVNDKGFADHMAVADALNVNTYFTGLYKPG